MVALLFFFAPEKYPFYPRCLFHALTGLECPGCGGLRAAHHLLHGEFTVALHYNPLLILLLPLMAGGLIARLARRVSGRAPASPFDHPLWLWLFVAAVVAFGIARNLTFGAQFRL
jgi:hypothetical protein